MYGFGIQLLAMLCLVRRYSMGQSNSPWGADINMVISSRFTVYFDLEKKTKSILKFL